MIVGEVMKVNCCEEKLKTKEGHCHVLFAPFTEDSFAPGPGQTPPLPPPLTVMTMLLLSSLPQLLPACLLIEFNVV